MTHTFPKDFSTPVLALTSLGEKAARSAKWPDYMALDLTAEHVPELIRILGKLDEFWPEEDVDTPETYTPIHVWRVLGQLRAEQAIPALIETIIWNEDGETDWIMEEIPEIMGMLGPVCIPSLETYLLSKEKKVWASVTMGHCLAEIGKQHPESRSDCVAVLQAGLEGYADQDETINGFLISYLADLKAVEAAPLVARAYQADSVDYSVMGDFEEFQIAVGLLKERQTPPPRFNFFENPQAQWEEEKKSRKEAGLRQRQEAKKDKKKRKQARKTRRGKRGKRK